MSRKERMEELKEDSGTITYADPLTSFLYQLLRDHLPAGEVEKIVCDVIAEGGVEVTFTNGWLAKYANNLADKIRSAATVKLKADLDKVWQEEEKEEEKPAVKKPVKEALEDDDLVAVRALLDDKADEGNVPDETVMNSLEESKAALESMLASGQLSDEEAARIKTEIGDLLGDLNEEAKTEDTTEEETEVDEKNTNQQ